MNDSKMFKLDTTRGVGVKLWWWLICEGLFSGA